MGRIQVNGKYGEPGNIWDEKRGSRVVSEEAKQQRISLDDVDQGARIRRICLEGRRTGVVAIAVGTLM